MCVRYVGVDPRAERTAAKTSRMDGSLYPGENGLFVRPGGEIVEGRWGLQPGWAKDPSFGKKNAYNARCETVHEKPTFRSAFKARRCVLPASAFFERADGRWLRVLPRHEETFTIAALWEPENERTDGLPTYTMVTTEPNLAMENVHDRMPVILDPDAAATWMDLDAPPELIKALMCPCPPEWIGLEDAGPVTKKRPGETEALF